jgi:hypothetical protein
MSNPGIVMTEAEPTLVDEIERKLLASIRSSQPQALNSGFTLAMRDESGGLIAGLAASTAEAEGMRRGCHGAWLDTSMLEAAGFYERLGYEIFGTLENEPGDMVPGHRRWFMRKRFACP